MGRIFIDPCDMLEAKLYIQERTLLRRQVHLYQVHRRQLVRREAQWFDENDLNRKDKNKK